MSAAEARKSMSDLLKARRADLTPEMMGLKSREGLTTPELSRTETAYLAGISFYHYQRIEQGTAVGVSVEVVAKICDALQMDAAAKDQILALHEVWASPRRGPRS
ncbi:helix-turn-helix transcriptional regulator [Rhodococcus cerastii]|nr:helix-turn-helix transcriptional regulator [Rhodococcus cerastii]